MRANPTRAQIEHEAMKMAAREVLTGFCEELPEAEIAETELDNIIQRFQVGDNFPLQMAIHRAIDLRIRRRAAEMEGAAQDAIFSARHDL